MSFLKKIFRKEDTHEQWLEKHPGKGAPKAMPPLTTADEDASVRSHMEEELAAQRTRREGTD